jgi:hypothetical protein
MLLNTIVFGVAWLLLSVLLVLAFYIAFKMSKKTKGASLVYAIAPVVIIIANIFFVPYFVRGPSLAWLQMILAPDVWAGHLLILLAFFALICLLVIAVIAGNHKIHAKTEAYAKLIALYIAAGASTALLLGIYGFFRPGL